MQAYKLKGTIDQTGHLIVNEAIDLQPGEVEIIVLQSVPSTKPEAELQVEPPQNSVHSKTKAFRDLLKTSQPVPPDFDPDQARWEALKEKYDL